MLAILNSLNAHNFPIFQLILMILVLKSMVHSALSDRTYFSLGLLSPLKKPILVRQWSQICNFKKGSDWLKSRVEAKHNI